MYNFSENIRIRNCGELSFLVDISNNSLLMLQTNTLSFLELNLNQGLTKEKLKSFDISFINFIRELVENNILEVSEYEV